MKEHLTLRAEPGTKDRIVELARRAKKRPYTLAAELLAAAIAAAEAAAPVAEKGRAA